jgi:hypothetical protein
MKKVLNELEDELRTEYEPESLQVRKVGPKRKDFGIATVALEPDVAELFPDSESVNEALRLLIRIVKENKHTFSSVTRP